VGAARTRRKNPETRAHRRHSVPCQQLRGDAARLIEWFRILLRLGWVAGRHARTECDERPVRGDRRLRAVLRDRHRLAVPYGAYAHAAGLAPDPEPPPADDGKPPPGQQPDAETT
jgi:hypothetical protein